MEEDLPEVELPKIYDFPPPIPGVGISATEQRLYLQLSIEFTKILNDAPSFQMGAYQWNQILPSRLQRFAISPENWEKISRVGDNSEELQSQLADLIEKYGLNA